MQDKHAYSIFRPVDLRPIGGIDSESWEAPSPFPEDEHGDPISQLRAYRRNSHPLTLLAKARTPADIAALAQMFAPRTAGHSPLSPQAVQAANANSYRSMFRS